MIKVALSKLNSQTVSGALTALVQEKLDPTTGYRVDRIMRAAGAEFIKAKHYEITQLKLHAKVDEKGEVVFTRPEGLPPNHPFPGVPEFKSEDDAKEHDKKMKAYFDETTLELKVHPIPFHALTGLNGQQVGALADAGLLDGVPEEP